jgi:hypothetical protein
VVFLCGIPSESPLVLVREALDKLGTPYVQFNQRQFATTRVTLEIRDGAIGGQLEWDGHRYPLDQFSGIYTRLMDDRLLPELRHEPPDSSQRRYCRGLHDALMRWHELAPGRVVNRYGPMGSNFSKPYQAQLIRTQGFLVPETLITNDPALVRAFYDQHRHIIYKSISGVRSIVQRLEEADFDRLDHIRWCPTQFQVFVPGTNVRVHTIGDRVFATAISSDATDYRYAPRQTGEAAALREVDLHDDVAAQCVALSRALGLDFAGIDLKVTPDQEVYCFEVNPCPAFSYYQSNTGQPIADAVADYLSAA